MDGLVGLRKDRRREGILVSESHWYKLVNEELLLFVSNLAVMVWVSKESGNE